MAQYSDINQVIKDLISNKNLTDTDILQYLSTEDKKTLWEKVAAFMESEGIKLDHLYPIWENDFTGNSLFKFLSENIDLDKSPNYHFITILNDLKAKTNEDGSLNTSDPKLYPWNESLATAITYYLRFLSNARDFETQAAEYNEDMTEVIDTHGSINTDGELGNRGGFRVKSITTGDAGRSFTEKPWVRPNYNIDAETYDAVRGLDEMLEALKSNKEMQFTNSNDSSLSNYLRLLMPKYLRRVEVEDLNRNFWVIGQVLAAVCSYLFDPDSPITNEFKKILNEIVQLWENVLYLWVLFAIISQEDAKPPITDIHTEIVYLPNDKYRNFLKYDAFAESSASIDYQALFGYLKEAYTESNLCIIPVLRDNNYYRNYYAYEFYPRYITYNRNTDTWGGATIGVTGNQIMVDVKNEDFPFPTMYRYIGAIREVENEKYNFIYPYSKVQDRYEKEPNKYYAILRMVPTDFTCAYENDTVKLKSLKVELHDVTTLCSSLAATRKIGDWTYNGTTLSFERASSFAELSDEKNVDPAKGFYMGELSSYFDFTKQKEYTVNQVKVETIPIRENTRAYSDSDTTAQGHLYTAGENYTIDSIRNYSNISSVLSQVKNKDTNFLSAYANRENSSGSSQDTLFKLYVCTRSIGLYREQEPQRQDYDTEAEYQEAYRAYLETDPIMFNWLEGNTLHYDSSDTDTKNNIAGTTYCKNDWTGYDDQARLQFNRMYVTKLSTGLDTSAILYNGENNQFITYEDFSFIKTPGYWAYDNNGFGQGKISPEIWVYGDKLEENNWRIKYIQNDGAQLRADNGRYYYYDVNGVRRELTSSEYCAHGEIERNQAKKPIGIIKCANSVVQCNIFCPDGTMAYKNFTRLGYRYDSDTGTYNINSDALYPSPNNPALSALGYDGTTESYGGHAWYVKKSDNYNALDPNGKSGWRLFNEAYITKCFPIRVNADHSITYQRLDYTKNPATGLF